MDVALLKIGSLQEVNQPLIVTLIGFISMVLVLVK